MRKKGEKKGTRKESFRALRSIRFDFFLINDEQGMRERYRKREREKEKTVRLFAFIDPIVSSTPPLFFPLSRRKRNTDRSFRTVFALSKRAARFLSRRENRSGIHVLVIGNESKSQGSGTIESHEQKEN